MRASQALSLLAALALILQLGSDSASANGTKTALIRALKASDGTALVERMMQNPEVATSLVRAIGVSELPKSAAEARALLVAKLSAESDPAIHERVAALLGNKLSNVSSIESCSRTGRCGNTILPRANTNTGTAGAALSLVTMEATAEAVLGLDRGLIAKARQTYEGPGMEEELASFNRLVKRAADLGNSYARTQAESMVRMSTTNLVGNFIYVLGVGVGDFSVDPLGIEEHLDHWPIANQLKFSEMLSAASSKLAKGETIKREEALELALKDMKPQMLERYKKGCTPRK